MTMSVPMHTSAGIFSPVSIGRQCERESRWYSRDTVLRFPSLLI